MGIDKTWKRELPGKVNDPCRRAYLFPDRLVRPEGQDLPGLDGGRFNGGVGSADGINPAVDQDQIRAFFLPALQERQT